MRNYWRHLSTCCTDSGGSFGIVMLILSKFFVPLELHLVLAVPAALVIVAAAVTGLVLSLQL